jgi:purine-binding chemotaxis protein CheW
MTRETQSTLHHDSSQHEDAVQLLTFTVGKEEYGMNIMAVREIKGWNDTTRLPNAPGFVRGVMNLRGSIIPIFDLRSRFEMGETDPTEKHVVIIFAVAERTIGILVDTVSDILTVPHSEVHTAPAMETHIDDDFVTGLISVNDRMVVVLHTDSLFDEASLASAKALQEALS